MKRNKYIIAIVSILASLCVTSCEDFLEESNPNSESTSEYWSTLLETDATLTSLYAALYEEDLLSIIPGALMSDMAYPQASRSTTSSTSLRRFFEHSYLETDSYISGKWADLYTGIFRANQVIYALEEVVADLYVDEEGEDTTLYTQQMAEARYLRGLFYHYLYCIFNNGSVPIHTTPANSQEEFYKPCSTAVEVLAQSREDLLFAFENLDTSNTSYYSSNEQYGRATRYAAATTLAVSYMYSATEDPITGPRSTPVSADIDTAIYYLEEVINSGLYSLAEPEVMFTSAQGDFTTESIFEINYCSGLKEDATYTSEYKTTNYLGRTSTTSYMSLPVWVLYDYEHEAMDPNNSINTIEKFDLALPSGTEFYQGPRMVSSRCSAMIRSYRDHYTSYYLNPSCMEANQSVSTTAGVGYYRKYTNWDITDSENTVGGDNYWLSGKNVVIHRLAEVYLLYAEALIYKNNVPEAIYYMNLIRERWGLLLLGTPDLMAGRDNMAEATQESSYDMINYISGSIDYNETTKSLLRQLQNVDKAMELSAEGHFIRFLDLRRWGMLYDRYVELETRNTFVAERVFNMEWSAEERELCASMGDNWDKPNTDSEIASAKVTCYTILDFSTQDDDWDGDQAWITLHGIALSTPFYLDSKITDADKTTYDYLNYDYTFIQSKSPTFFDSFCYWPIPAGEKLVNYNL
ncbi:MAG: RagB/SusD family nutrient uptake outer membrane protein [Rikenellaceae bacterium]